MNANEKAARYGLGGLQVLALIVVHDSEMINYCYCYRLGG